jgi:hypothetical protein
MLLLFVLIALAAVVNVIALQEQGAVREVHARNEVFGSIDGNFAAGHNSDE